MAATSILSQHWDHSPYRDANRIAGSTSGVWVRRSTALCLQHIQKYLDINYPGLHIIAYDGLRLPEPQIALHNAYLTQLTAIHAGDPTWTPDRLVHETMKYVSRPSTDPTAPPMHSAGAVDCLLVELDDESEHHLRSAFGDAESMRGSSDRAMQLALQRLRYLVELACQVDFGTNFDHGGERSAAGHYRNSRTRDGDPLAVSRARANRELLYHLWQLPWIPDSELHGADRLLAYEHEWWHAISSGSQAGTKIRGANIATLAGVRALNPEMEALDARYGRMLSIGPNRSGLPMIERIAPEPMLQPKPIGLDTDGLSA